ncbi:hypothetical protein H7849_04965 [Alloacidobacterium dinghuense]|uniref:Uncharacterized protein n=1 Tax=Alloacidobacterium dinghuense TaxID=2763107 RepID=A0A7G8BL94_9BACT|nr:hypothetical protein [Alloacidobacterium dinghuense]QNI33314.1 hypothetical protein H7849_04965 [Alloacidobacterium dinghuense]
MEEYPLTVQGIVMWLRSKASGLESRGVTLAGVQERHMHIPAAFGDFDSEQAMGRITAWTSGHVDFEVLRTSDGKDAFIRHEMISNLDAPALEIAFGKFLQKMMRPDEPI